MPGNTAGGGQWDAWLGREMVATDRLDQALARRWSALFDLPQADDGAMPQGIHFCLCTPDAATAELGIDGHPARDDSAGSFFPPVPLPRRMWASSTIAFLSPIALGAQITRTSRIASIAEKEGSSGKLAFVDVDHVTIADGTEALRETQTLVYRDAVAADAPLSPPPQGDGAFDPGEWDRHVALTPSEVLLFRFSALTFNTHRIHYDAPYASAEERYRGLVVHGPLMASLMLQMAARELGENRLTSFAFRAVSPAITGETLHLAMRQDGDTIELGSFASDGRQCVKASGSI
ncbi:MAG: MaoC family dehydratase N-terminal domain-containing protein [Erythrobacter sp.]